MLKNSKTGIKYTDWILEKEQSHPIQGRKSFVSFAYEYTGDEW